MSKGARRSQEDSKFITGGARRSQGEPGGARRSQEEPGGARITRTFHKRPIGKARGTWESPGAHGRAQKDLGELRRICGEFREAWGNQVTRRSQGNQEKPG